MRTRPLYDIVALLARIGVGTVFIAHGWQKIQVGITTTSDQFTTWDVPVPTAAAVYATFVELLGGVALILGLGLPVVGVLLFIDMAGALAFVNGKHGIFLVAVDQSVAKGGFELVLLLGLVSLLFAVGGAGRLTLDNRLFGRREATAAPPLKRRGVAAPAEQHRGPADITSASSVRPAKPTPPTMPTTSGVPTVPEAAASPRLASDIVTDTSGDTLVAGRKSRRSARKRSLGDTQPISKPGVEREDTSDA